MSFFKENHKSELNYFSMGKNSNSFVEYELFHVEFDDVSRRTVIHINQKKHYRTIDRYVQRNYQRTPIYSDWKIRVKRIEKKLVLINSELENLVSSDDEIIRQLAFQIVFYIIKHHSADLAPSWYNKALNEFEMNNRINEESQKFDEIIQKLNTDKEDIDKNILILEKHLNKLAIKLKRLESRCIKIEKNIGKGTTVKFFLSLITLFIFYAFNNKNRLKNTLSNIEDTRALMGSINNDINLGSEYRNEIEETINEQTNEKESSIKSLREYYSEKISEIKSLNDTVKIENGFILLRDYYGNDKLNKIKVGCYVIRNNLNGKAYVGQSKDIPHRIRTHFNGLVPKNHIFFEDYYKDKENKDLFSVKIVEGDVLKLDLQEMQLIEEYSAFDYGYNKTIGNATTLRRVKEQLAHDDEN